MGITLFAMLSSLPDAGRRCEASIHESILQDARVIVVSDSDGSFATPRAQLLATRNDTTLVKFLNFGLEMAINRV
ncbi:MAG: hypothetical protein M1347_01560 [Chloroflexi bacterium]|nr:hypothetical protein [Chloroflexota bacterium]